MFPISYRRHRFPPTVIQHAVWLYLRFTLSYRDVEEFHQGLDRFDLGHGPADIGLGDLAFLRGKASHGFLISEICLIKPVLRGRQRVGVLIEF
jgi:hypothetical protein